MKNIDDNNEHSGKFNRSTERRKSNPAKESNTYTDSPVSSDDFYRALETGLNDRQFRLHYQPIVPVSPQGPISFEALMRWYHPSKGVLPASSFLSGLEEAGMLARFGIYMLDCLFRDARYLLNESVSFGRIAFNVTGADLSHDAFLHRFFMLAEYTGVEPNRFCAEITEGVDAGAKTLQTGLQCLHEAGVEIALDDFGTGFASLVHLRALPIDRLKIDRHFVTNISSCARDRAIVQGIVEIAHSLGQVVTAEGVETEHQARVLTDMRCDFLQGWLFGKAHPIEALATNIVRSPVLTTSLASAA